MNGYIHDRYIHISIDDTIKIFEDLTINEDKYNTIFENQTLKFLKECNDEYGAEFSLYCFYSFAGVNLENCTGKFKEEFEENSEWLKFGFHALNSEVDYMTISASDAKAHYEETMNELIRIVGEKSVTRVISMEKFVCSKENVEVMRECEFGIVGLLGADTQDRQNYYLADADNLELFSNGYLYDESLGISIYATDIRVENFNDIDKILEEHETDENLIIFTHEWALDKENKKKLEEICEFAEKNNYVYEID